MFEVGIDTIGFYTPHYYLDLKALADMRCVDPNKFYVGLGQRKMAVPAPGEDVVTMGANAALRALRHVNRDEIDTVLFATETGIDQSKAAGIYVHHLLKLPAHCRVVELKQACYSATAAIAMALPMIQQNPDRKILVIAADIARYGLETAGESSQGAGAIGMVLSVNPRLLVIEPESGFYTEDVMDFWRPNYREEALVQGKYSCDLYLRLLEETWRRYKEVSGRNFSDHDYFCYHVPVPRLVEKAHQKLGRVNDRILSKQEIMEQLEASLYYGRETGNCYTAALYLALNSLIDMASGDLSDKRIGCYSYGSGCVGEYFSARVKPSYHEVLDTTYNTSMLGSRLELSQKEYEIFYQFSLPTDGRRVEIPHYDTGYFHLSLMQDHKRLYERRMVGSEKTLLIEEAQVV